MAEGFIDEKYGELPKDIVDKLKEYEFIYFREDQPVPFCGLQVYPATVRDFETFSSCTGCLTLNKNEDPRGIMMSHLDYLIAKTQIQNEENEGRMWSYRIQKLFEIIFHIKNGLKCKKCGHVIAYDSPEFQTFIKQIQELTEHPETASEETAPSLLCPECGGKDFMEMMKFVQDPKTKKYSLLIDGHLIKKDDFALLRQLVLYQNFPDYADDSWVDPEIKKDHDEKMRLQQQQNDVHASIEKKVICLSISTNYRLEDIWGMPIRKFTMALSTVDDLINYKIMKQAVMGGFVQLPKGKSIEHWIYKPNKDMYGDSYKSTDEVQQSASNL